MLFLLMTAAVALAFLLAPLPLAPTNLYINWSAVSFTPTGGALTAIGKVTDCKIAKGGTPEHFKGDIAVYAQCLAVPDRHRTVTVSTGDIAAALLFAQGTVGSFTATLGDAINGSAGGGGGKIYTMTTCVIVSNNADSAHAKFGNAQIVFEGYSSDGATDPCIATSA
jgi:hypothetical protein